MTTIYARLSISLKMFYSEINDLKTLAGNEATRRRQLAVNTTSELVGSRVVASTMSDIYETLVNATSTPVSGGITAPTVAVPVQGEKTLKSIADEYVVKAKALYEVCVPSS